MSNKSYQAGHSIGQSMRDAADWPINYLNGICGPLFESRLFQAIIAVTVFLNPVAIFPQMIAAITAPDISGISIGMWIVFIAIQLAFVLQGVRTKSPAVFYSMLLSLIESTTIIVVVLIRG